MHQVPRSTASGIGQLTETSFLVALPSRFDCLANLTGGR